MAGNEVFEIKYVKPIHPDVDGKCASAEMDVGGRIVLVRERNPGELGQGDDLQASLRAVQAQFEKHLPPREKQTGPRIML